MMDSPKDASNILSVAIKERYIQEESIYTVCICMFQALFSSTVNQACG